MTHNRMHGHGMNDPNNAKRCGKRTFPVKKLAKASNDAKSPAARQAG